MDAPFEDYALAVPEEAFDVVLRRRSFSLQSIIEVRLEIEERKRLGHTQELALEEILGELRLSKSALGIGPFSAEAHRSYQEIVKTIAELTRHRTQTTIDTWRDVTLLKQQLRALLKEYWGTPQP